MSLRLVTFYGSVRSERQGIRAARFVVNECRARGHEVALVDPVEYPLPLLDKMYKEYPPGGAPDTLQRIADLIVPADGIIVVSGEYNHSIARASAEVPRRTRVVRLRAARSSPPTVRARRVRCAGSFSELT